MTLHDNFFRQDFTCTWNKSHFHETFKIVNERRIIAIKQFEHFNDCHNLDALISSDYAEKVAEYKILEEMKKLVDDEYKPATHHT